MNWLHGYATVVPDFGSFLMEIPGHCKHDVIASSEQISI